MRAQVYWTGATSGAWGTKSNWSTGSVPSKADLIFNGSATTNWAITLGAARTENSLTFTDASGANGFTFTGSTLTVSSGGITNNDSDSIQTFSSAVAVGADQTWNAGSGGLTFANVTLANNLTLSGTAGISFTGTLTNSGGAHVLTNNDTGAVSIKNINLSATSDLTPGTLTISGADSTTTTVTGVIANGTVSGGSLTKDGAGMLVLSGANTYTGATTIDAGTLQLGAANRISNASAVVIAGGTFDLNNFAETVSSIAGAGNITLGSAVLTAGGDNTSTTFSGVISGTGGLTKTGTGALTLSGDNIYTGTTTIGTTTADGGILNIGSGSALPAGNPVTVRSGTLDLNGHDETIGALILGGSSSLTNAVVNTGGGTLTLGGGVTYSATNNPAGAEIDGLLDLGGATRTFAVGDSSNADADLTVAAAISGDYGITKTGVGTLVLSGANTYTGTTTIGTTIADGGTLRLGSNSAIPAGNAVTVHAGTLDLSGHDETIGALILGGSSSPTKAVVDTGGGTLTMGGNVTYTANASATVGAEIDGLLDLGGATRTFAVGDSLNADADLTVAAAISGAGYGITKTGAGTLVLSGANTYTGTTTIGTTTADGGTLRLDSGSALPAGNPVTVRSGILDLNGHDETIGALILGGSSSPTKALVETGAGKLTLGGNVTYSATNLPVGAEIVGALDLGGADRTFTVGQSSNAGGADLTINAVISGAGHGITKTGLGTLVLSGANTYTGVTNVSAGTLTLGVGQNMSGVLVLGGGTLNLGTYSSTFASLSLTGNSTIVFADVGSTLNVGSISDPSGHTLDVLSWDSGTDFFIVTNDPGAAVLSHISFNGSSGGARWIGGQLTPVPEPSFYAALMALGLFAGLLWFRARRAPRAC